MPPKKSANKTPAKHKNPKELPAKKKPQQLKPKLKIPSVITVKIGKKNAVDPPKDNGLKSSSKAATKLPLAKQVVRQSEPQRCTELTKKETVNPPKHRGRKSSSKAVTKVPLAKQAVKQSEPQRCVELANEVAQAQLLKDCPIKLEPEPEQVVKKKGRRGKKKAEDTNQPVLVNMKNNIEDANQALEHEASVSTRETATEFETPQRKKRGRSSQKSLNKSLNHKDQDSVKIQDKTPKSECPIPKKRTWTQSKITDLKICIRRSSDGQNKKNNPRTVKINSKPRLVRTIMTRGKKNCVENSPVSQCQSPSILDQGIHQPNVNVTDNITKKELNENEPRKLHSTVASAIQSRTTSVTPISECLSWTKDISSSSATTSITASSSDFVLINNQFPTLKLTNITNIMAKRSKEASGDDANQSLSDSESSDVSTKCTSNRTGVIPDVDCNSLNLSTSSISNSKLQLSGQKNNSVNTLNNGICKLGKVMEKLSLDRKNIDEEIIDWIGYSNKDLDFNCNKIKEKIFKALDYETNVIVEIKNLEKNLAIIVPVFEQETTVEKEFAKEQSQDQDKFIKPSDITLTKSVCNPKTLSTEKCRTPNHSKSRCISQTEKAANYSYEDNGDDDDALSLFAESITGIESSRRNSAIGSPPRVTTDDFEEYVPQPVIATFSAETMTKKHTYNPTKITNDGNEPAHSVKTIVCEKQSADSTSIYKDSSDQVDRPNTNSVETFNQFAYPGSPVLKVAISPTAIKTNDIPSNRGPCIFTDFRPQGLRSLIFKGICFYNMIAACNKGPYCQYSHVQPNSNDIKTMLGTLNYTQFLHEYVFLRNWKPVREAYGMCFIEECKRRQMTRLLIEIVIDIVAQTNNSHEDTQLKVHVLEYSLLYLNTIKLATVEGLLMFTIQGVFLCDMYMQTIANTQNFSRFKSVFINLTQFIIKHSNTFRFDVATQLLERIAILPYEEAVARAVINIIERTEPAIFDNSMMGQFENQLSASNLELYRALLSIKDKLSGRPGTCGKNMKNFFIPPLLSTNTRNPQLFSPVGQPSLYASNDKDQPGNNLVYSERDQRYTSPDTTHLDNMGKATEEPIITRTINFDLSKSYTTPNFSGGNNNESVEDCTQNTPKPTNHFQRWRGRGSFRGPRFFSPAQRGFPPRGHMKRHMDRQVTYGNNPSKFPRRTGPDFF